MPDRESVRATVERLLKSRCKFPPILVEALIVAEDKRYFFHAGIDFYAVVRAILANLVGPCRQGASTIEQQLVRVITRQRQRTFRRKIREMTMASWLSSKFSKDDLAKAYLLSAHFGFEESGLDIACRRLRIDFRNLSVLQAAIAIARIRHPAGNFPTTTLMRRITKRANFIVGELGSKSSGTNVGRPIVTASRAGFSPPIENQPIRVIALKPTLRT